MRFRVHTLDDRVRAFDYFSLHGNAAGVAAARWKFNLHLAVRPKVGATARVVSGYGPVFTIEDAEAIESGIRSGGPIEALAELEGYEMYYSTGARTSGLGSRGIRRRWRRPG